MKITLRLALSLLLLTFFIIYFIIINYTGVDNRKGHDLDETFNGFFSWTYRKTEYLLTGNNRTFSIRNKSFIIAMIIRDRLYALPYISKNIELMAKRVKKLTVLVVENDSQENIVDWFKDWQKRVTQNKEMNIVDVDFRPHKWGTIYKHIPSMARARNMILKAVREEEKYQGYDFFVIVDTDICYRWDMDFLEEVLDSLLISQGKVWDAVFANGMLYWENGLGDHFDRFAYRDDLIVWDEPEKGILYKVAVEHKLPQHIQWWYQNTFMNPWNCTPVPGKYDKWDCQMVNGQPLINVHSAFGGLGFYSSHLIYHIESENETCSYSAPFDDCEHVAFHKCLRKRYQAKLVVAPRMIIPWSGCEGESRYHEQAKVLMNHSKDHPPLLLQ